MNENNTTQLNSDILKSTIKNPILFSWGNNINGQLGLGHENKSVTIPSQIEFSKPIKKIEASKNSSMILTAEGNVYSFGSARGGNLGHDFDTSARNESIPRLIDSLEDKHIIDMSMSEDHAAVVDNKGQLLAWGSNNHGKLGVVKEKKQNKPRSRQIRDHSQSVIKEPVVSKFFGQNEGQIFAQKVHCSNQNTFVIGLKYKHFIDLSYLFLILLLIANKELSIYIPFRCYLLLIIFRQKKGSVCARFNRKRKKWIREI